MTTTPITTTAAIEAFLAAAITAGELTTAHHANRFSGDSNALAGDLQEAREAMVAARTAAQGDLDALTPEQAAALKEWAKNAGLGGDLDMNAAEIIYAATPSHRRPRRQR